MTLGGIFRKQDKIDSFPGAEMDDKKLAPVPPIPAKNTSRKENDFSKGYKWGSGISLGCFSVGCLPLILLFFITIGAGSSNLMTTPEDQIQEQLISGNGNDKVAVIGINGVILSQSSPTDIKTNAVAPVIISALEKARKDTTVKAVVLNINSPGGEMGASVEIFEFVKKLAKEKKVVAYFKDIAASGGYYAALPADQIYAPTHAWTGSIGVVMSISNFEGLFEKVGYKETVIKSGELKDMGSYSRPITDKEMELFQQMINASFEQFVEAVSDERNLEKNKVKELADGRIYTANQAREVGLIDAIGNFEQALSGAANLANITDYTLVEYIRPVSFSEMFLGSVSKLSLPYVGRNIGLPTIKYQWFY
jgi:protease IV